MTVDAPVVVLDTDGSVLPMPGERRLALQDRQEQLRLGASRAVMQALAREIDSVLTHPHRTVFTGSGDFHHLSALLVARVRPTRPLRVIVLDNHPDNMRFPGHIHCGSWVSHAADLPHVAHIDVVGMTSRDIGWMHAWENRLAPLRAGRVRYWSVGVDTRWARWVGAASAMRSFGDMDALVRAVTADIGACTAPLYLSIDKDVFAPDVLRTNWDQGLMRPSHAAAIVAACGGRIVASDITGEVSIYRYRSRWKRLVSAADGQDANLSEAQIAFWRSAQHAMNCRLLDVLAGARAPG